MLPDLERLIRLQQLDNAATAAQRTVDAIPTQIAQLNDRRTASQTAVETAQARVDTAKRERQSEEKNLAEVNSRLSRFKEQLMAVKTNKEYSAMQHEIATAEQEVQQLEDKILESMLEADALASEVSTAKTTATAEGKQIESEQTELDKKRGELEGRLAGTSDERAKLTEDLSGNVRQMFETISKQRHGIAVVEARDGLCTVCNVRLRPQVFNQVLLNAELVQCDSCMRILYHDPDGQYQKATEETPAS